MDVGASSNPSPNNHHPHSHHESAMAPTPPEPASSSARPKKLERSCMMCHQRKIRCDKRSPCSNCSRAAVLCYYPSPQRSERRPHKTTIADVVSRLAILERTITAIQNDASQKNPMSKSTEDSTLFLEQPNPEILQNRPPSPTDELLVQDGGTSRYFNEILLSKILAEEEELRSVLGSPSADDSQSPDSSSFDTGGVLFGPNHAIADSQICQPTRWQAIQLWQIFLANVDPIIKILHIPTTQGDIYATMNDMNGASYDLKALVFSVYFAAATSLTSDTAASLLGQERKTAIESYKRGLEHSLSRSNILDAPSIRSLQALTIYITCLRAYNCGRAAWALTGLAERIAQSIGIHRDGNNFRLSPFETEMRRRLWCFMRFTDLRAAEDFGISLATSDPSFDTNYPLNVNDSEISPGMESMPVAKLGYTDIAFTLIQIETSHFCPKVIQTRGLSVPMPSQESRSQLFKEHISYLEDTYLRHCDENIPVQRLTIMSGHLIISKIEFLLKLQQSLDRRGSLQNVSSYSDEGTLTAACNILEANLQVLSDELLRGYRWYLSTYFQFHILTYVLCYLCIKPHGTNSARAFKLVDDSFEIVNFDRTPRSKWKVMLQLKDRAIRFRDTSNSDLNSAENLAEVQALTGELGESNDFAFGGVPNWNLNAFADYSDWSNLVNESFGMDGL